MRAMRLRERTSRAGVLAWPWRALFFVALGGSRNAKLRLAPVASEERGMPVCARL
jgi:hypothetical protein